MHWRDAAWWFESGLAFWIAFAAVVLLVASMEGGK